MRSPLPFALLLALLSAGCAARPNADGAALRQQVADTERAFAQTMADRDHAAFIAHLAEEAVFFSGDTPLRGRAAIAEAWKHYYHGPDAPFSWSPAQIEVLDSGTLALSSGPVRDAAGRRIGTFTSIWRRDASGIWRIVLDKGAAACATDAAPGS